MAVVVLSYVEGCAHLLQVFDDRGVQHATRSRPLVRRAIGVVARPGDDPHLLVRREGRPQQRVEDGRRGLGRLVVQIEDGHATTPGGGRGCGRARRHDAAACA